LKTNNQKPFLKLISFFNNPIEVFCISFVVYLAFAIYGNDSIFKPSTFSYFNYLADAFLHGQLDFRLDPPIIHDLVLFNDEIYAYWPPFPAVIMMPFVAIFGVNFSDILFTIFLGSLNVALLSVLFSELRKKEIVYLEPIKQGLLIIFFAFGTVYLTMVPLGRVWFTALVVGVFCVILTYLFAVKFEGTLSFFLTGLAISAAAATRMHLILVGIWPAWYLLSKNWKKPKKQLIKFILAGLLPLLITGLLIFYYNYARFGNILDVGLDYHQMSEFFREDYNKYGAFNIHYFVKNFYYQYLAYPFLSKDATNFFMGGSLFLLSPLFFAAFWVLKEKDNIISNAMLTLTIILTNIPILLLMGTGFVQFGPRYSLDFTVPLLILTARGIRTWPNRIIALLVLISIIHYFVGLYAFIISLGS